MNEINTIIGDLVLQTPARFALVSSRFNDAIVEQLERGCIETLRQHGVANENITLVKVPGARELPVAAKRLAQNGKHDAIIAIGVIIRGATPHFDYVASSCSSGLDAVATAHGLPVIFGVLTTDSIEQALERAGTKAGNKGADAARTAIEMVSLLRKLGA